MEKKEGERTASDPHLSPSFVNSISQRHDLIQLGNISWDDQDVRFADLGGKLLSDTKQFILLNVSDGDF